MQEWEQDRPVRMNSIHGGLVHPEIGHGLREEELQKPFHSPDIRVAIIVISYLRYRITSEIINVSPTAQNKI